MKQEKCVKQLRDMIDDLSDYAFTELDYSLFLTKMIEVLGEHFTIREVIAEWMAFYGDYPETDQ